MASESGRRGAAMPPTYPGFDVMAEQLAWDPVTRAIVAARLRPPPPRALDEAEVRTLTAAARRLLAEERPEVLAFVVAHVDARLSSGTGEGQRQAAAPPEAELLRRGLAALDRATRGDAAGFAGLTAGRQDRLLGALAQGQAEPAGAFAGLPQKVLFQKLLSLAAEALASHPAVWSEIGYAGPAYPRGYYRMGRGVLDPWEPRAQPGGRRREGGRDQPAPPGDGQRNRRVDGRVRVGDQVYGRRDGQRATGGDSRAEGRGNEPLLGRRHGQRGAQRPGDRTRQDGDPRDSRRPAGDGTGVGDGHAAREALTGDLADLDGAGGSPRQDSAGTERG